MKRDNKQPIERVMTLQDQERMSPSDVLESLKEGNQRYIENDLTPKDLRKQRSITAPAQYPKAVIHTCIDSRLPVEYIFDANVGDLFVARVGGNIVNPDILGSLEFSCAVTGSKLIVVLGHDSCGAVMSAINKVKMGNITTMVSKIQPAIQASQDFIGARSSENSDYVTHVCINNVFHTIDDIRERSPILKELEDKRDIMIVGAMYDMGSGVVRFL